MNGRGKLSSGELRSLAADVARLSRLLTRERDRLPAAYLKDQGLRRAYLAYFLPSNLYKIHLPLRELSLHPKNLLSKGTLSVLDVGSGPGTAVLGVLEFFAQWTEKPAIEFTAVDHVADNLKEAAALCAQHRERFGMTASLRPVRSGLENPERLPEGRHDLIILSNLLNELFPQYEDRAERRADFVTRILDRHLSDGGSCIIIEPALRETSREMLEVRDRLLDEDFHVYSPCLAGGKCPALVNPRDWCHEDRPWKRPALIGEIDGLTGLRKDSLKFSYLVLRKDPLSLSDVYGSGSFRVVSEPLVSKGKAEFYLCGSGGRRLITRLDKDGTPLNGPFEKMRRGDAVSFENVLDEKGRFKIGKETVVYVKRS